MSQLRIEHIEHDLNIVLEVSKDGTVRLMHFSPFSYEEEALAEKSRSNRRLVEVHCTGENAFIHHGVKHTGTLPGGRLKYHSHKISANELGNKMEITQMDPETNLMVISHLQCFTGLRLVKAWTELRNEGSDTLPLEYVSSFALTGAAREGTGSWENKMRIHLPHNTWCGEAQWRAYTLPELGLTHLHDHSIKRVSVSSIGTWSSYEFLPLAVLENTEAGLSLFWQIEHNGSWHWEVSDAEVNQLYVKLSGPTENEGHWFKQLRPGEHFVTVPAVVGVVKGTFTEAMHELVSYLRRIRRPNDDNNRLPVIFNDFMHCLWGNPSTDKLVPLIDAAASAGCEVFCIDAGWYRDGLGEWLPSTTRFDGGLQPIIRSIRDKGMIPGLWLELESVDTSSPLALNAPDEWFFCRHGKRVVDAGRYQLDFRHPNVIRHIDETVDRLLRDFGIGYFKFDYNQNAGIGTEVASDSPGDGLLEYNRAYLAWVDSLFKRHPQLVVENCASGGMRMDYATLSRFSIQSVTDQMDYRKMAVIAASIPSVVPAEQAGIWSYPLKGCDEEAVIFNMVNCMQSRIFLSGPLADIDEVNMERVREAIACYKDTRSDIPRGEPFWPLGTPTFAAGWACLGMKMGHRYRISLWRLNSEDEHCELTLTPLKDKNVTVRCAFPSKLETAQAWAKDKGTLSIRLARPYSARIFELEEAKG